MITCSRKDTYKDQTKYFRDENGRWVLPKNANISDEGRAIVEAEPDLLDETVESLMITDWDLLDNDKKVYVTTREPSEICFDVFYGNNETGLVHIAQCIQDNPKQPLAEMVSRYADERRIPYLLAAIYVKSLMAKSRLFYYKVVDNEYKKVEWKPTSYYVPPEIELPPEKKKRRIRKKPLTAIKKAPEYKLYLCPICNSPAKIYRCGKASRLWHACCTDENRTCVNYAGLAPVKTEKMAANAWNDYVKTVCENPVWPAGSPVKLEINLPKEGAVNA